MAGARGKLSRSVALAAVIWLVVLLALFWRLWTPIDGARRTFAKDAIHEYWGDLQFQRDAYADGELPLWNPFDRTGYPFHADPQAGLFYPPNWVLVGTAGLLGDTPYWLVAVKVVLHFWLACFGCWFYLRQRGLHTAACYAGGIAFIFSYPFFHNVFSALNWGVAWAPWILAAIDAWTRRPRRASAAVLALTGSMSFLAGAPASFFYALLVAVPYGAWAVFHAWRAADDQRAYRRELVVSGATAAGLFLAAIAAQLRFTGSIVAASARDERTLAFVTESVLGAQDIAGLLIPRMLGENTYLGAAVIVWGTLAITAFATPRRLVLAAVAAMGFALALGDDGHFLAVAASVFEPFGFFRRAHRYLYVCQLPVAILAAEGLDAILRPDADDQRGRLARWVIGWGVMALAVFGVGFAVNQPPGPGPSQLRDAFVFACLGTLVAVWTTLMILGRTASWRSAFAWIGVAALAMDLWLARISDVEKRLVPIPRPSRDAELARLDGVPLGVRIYDRDHLGYRPGTRLQIRDLGGYEDDPLALSRYHLLLDGARRSPRELAYLNVGWLLEAKSHALKRSAQDSKELDRKSATVTRVTRSAPAILWTDRAVLVEGGPEKARVALLRHPPGSTAVVEREQLPAADAAALALMARAPGPARAVSGRIVELERNRMVAEVDAPADGVVVVHEAFFPGWTASVDGEPVTLWPANVAFRGFRVARGHHRVVMEYIPPRALLWSAVSLLGLLGTIALAFWGSRRAPPPSTEGKA